MPGENLLEPTMSPAKIHFALFEPDNGIPLNLRDTFILDQNAFTLLMESKKFWFDADPISTAKTA